MKGLSFVTAAAFAVTTLAAQPASAQSTAIVIVDLNLRTGPDLSYPPVGVMRAGTPLTVFGCVEGYLWCDVAWGPNRGWVAGQYLAAQGPEPIPFSVYGPRYGIPIVSFVFGDYWDRYYRNRPWYAERERWDYWDYKGRRWRDGYDEKKWESRQGKWDPKRGDWDKRGSYDPKKYEPRKYDPKRGEDPKRGQFERKRYDPKVADPKKGGDPKAADPKKGGDPKGGDPKGGDPKGDPKKG